MGAALRYRQSPQALSRKVADSLLLTVRGGTDFHRLEGSAALIWGRLGLPMAKEEVVASVAGAYGIEPDEIRGQVVKVLEDFVRSGLVDLVETADG